jgi:hypothetical protein
VALLMFETLPEDTRPAAGLVIGPRAAGMP